MNRRKISVTLLLAATLLPVPIALGGPSGSSRDKAPASSAALGSSPAQPDANPLRGYRPQHQPEKVNPVWRSWQFTSPGDIVQYKITGSTEYDTEQWYYHSEREGKKAVIITRYKGGKEVKKLAEAMTAENAPSNENFTAFYEGEGYSSDYQVRLSGDKPFPCLTLENALEGKFIYSEDVPMGGLVYREFYGTPVIYELAGFKRQFSPAPSELPVWIRSGQDFLEQEASNDSIDMEKEFIIPNPGGKKTGGKKGEPATNVTSVGGVQIREDIDSTPAYFLPRGERTRELLKIGYVTVSHHLSPRVAVYYTVKRVSEDLPEEEYTLTKKVGVVFFQSSWYMVETIIDATGNVPEDVKIGIPVVKRFDPREFLLEKWPAYYVDIKSRQLGSGNVDVNHYIVLEGPFPQRKALPNGGEFQEVLRRRHDMFITRDLDPMMGKWQIRERWYSRETDGAGVVVKETREESYLIYTREKARPLTEQETFENLQAVREFVATSEEVVW